MFMIYICYIKAINACAQNYPGGPVQDLPKIPIKPQQVFLNTADYTKHEQYSNRTGHNRIKTKQTHLLEFCTETSVCAEHGCSYGVWSAPK